MSVGLILNLLNELNKSILCKPLANITVFHSTSSIHLVIILNEFNIPFITYPKKNFIVKRDHFSLSSLLYNAKV